MIVIKENNNVVGLFHNKLEDKFLENTINALGLNQANCRAYDFSAHANKIKRYEREDDKFYEVEGANIKLKSIQSEAQYEPKGIEFDAINALDYYSQADIDSQLANKAAQDAYFQANGTLDGFTLPNPEVEKVFGDQLISEAVIVEDEVVAGSEIDILNKIAAEQSEE